MGLCFILILDGHKVTTKYTLCQLKVVLPFLINVSSDASTPSSLKSSKFTDLFFLKFCMLR